MDDYRTLGKTGLKVSRLALGAMTFSWGADRATSRAIFQRYRDEGGNFIDTADLYSGGESEAWIGEFMKESSSRDEIVVATKFSFNSQAGNPNAGGNGRKNIIHAVEGSLRRLQTDYIDLYILHAYDLNTPVEEVMSTLNDLVRQGKVRHIGLSNVPAWYASRAQTIAELRGYEKIAALQLEYSLISRGLEREHMPLALELGISITPWSPLGSGFLTGKYRRENGSILGHGRVFDVKDSGNPVMEKFSKREQNWKVLNVLLIVAHKLGRTPAEVALSWVLNRPGVSSVLVGATKTEHLETSFKALVEKIPDQLLVELDEVSNLEENELDHFFSPPIQAMLNGGVSVGRGVR